MTAQLHTARVGATLIVTISAPATGNALRPEMLAAAVEILSTVERDHSIRAIVIKGAGHTFCSGRDIHHLAEIRTWDAQAQIDALEGMQTLIESIVGCNKPVIAAVEGMAAGAGLSLALACDLVVAAQSARFAAPGVTLGLMPESGVSWVLSQMLPRALADQMLLTGQPVDAQRLHAIGVVNRIADDGSAFDAALTLAEHMATLAPDIVASIKSTRAETLQPMLTLHFEAENHRFIESLRSRHAQEGIGAFIAKRKPAFR